MQWQLGKLGTVAAGTLTAKIYTNSGSAPGSLVGSGSSTLDRTTISGTAYYDFTGMSASLTNSTTYWAILQASSVDTNSSNCVLNIWDLTGESGDGRGSTDGSSWDSVGATRSFGVKFFS